MLLSCGIREGNSHEFYDLLQEEGQRSYAFVVVVVSDSFSLKYIGKYVLNPITVLEVEG